MKKLICLSISALISISSFNITLASSVYDTKLSSYGTTYGDIQGNISGTHSANTDFKSGKAFDPQKSLSDFISNEDLTSRFYLNNISKSYKDYFITSFKESYIDAYVSEYLDLQNGFSTQNEEFVKVENGANIITLNSDEYGKAITFTFPNDCLYGNNYISLSLGVTPVNYDTKNYIYTTPYFEINTFSNKNFIDYDYLDADKDFTMTINFDFGSDDVGIYEYKNGAWQYLYTDIEEGSISHTFKNGDYEGGKYCVFKQPNYKTFSDINFSPFSQEIYTYARRGAIYSTEDKFHPTSNITRGELSYIINAILNPNNTYIAPITQFSDIDNTSPFYNAINFVTSKGYINGVSSSQFGINENITYNQIKTIIERISETTYNINNIFDDMINNNFYRSKGIDNLNNFVSKEEAVYMLYDVLR